MRLRSGRTARTGSAAKTKRAVAPKPKDPCVACHKKTNMFKRVQCEHQGMRGKFMCYSCGERWYREKFLHGEYMRCFDERCSKIVCFRNLFTEADLKHREEAMASNKEETISEEMKFLRDTGECQMCPRCNIPVQHDGGCPVMTCPHCTVYFDYYTGVALH